MRAGRPCPCARRSARRRALPPGLSPLASGSHSETLAYIMHRVRNERCGPSPSDLFQRLQDSGECEREGSLVRCAPMAREVPCCTLLSTSSGRVSGGSGTLSWTHRRCLRTWKTSWSRCRRRKRNTSDDAGSAVDNARHSAERKNAAAVKACVWVACLAWEEQNVYRASAQEAIWEWGAQSATTLPEEGRDSRHPYEEVLLTSDSVHAGRCTCPRVRVHRAAASPRAPVSPPNRASPISLFCRDRRVFPHTVSLADGSRTVALWSGQRSWRRGVAANSTRADVSLPRSRTLSWS